MIQYLKRETKSLNKIVRVYAVIDIILGLLMIIDNCVKLFYLSVPPTLFHSSFGLFLKLFFLAFSVLVFLKPWIWWHLTINHVVIGIFIFIASNNSMLASLLFVGGWAIAYLFGFFKTNFYFKTLSILFLVVASILALYFAPDKMTSYSYTFVGASFLSFGLIFFLMKITSYHEKIDSDANSPAIRIELADYNFSEQELYAIAATLRDETYYAISLHLRISESTVKKMMLEIYNKFECKNREIFLDKIGACNVLYPRWFNPDAFREPLKTSVFRGNS